MDAKISPAVVVVVLVLVAAILLGLYYIVFTPGQTDSEPVAVGPAIGRETATVSTHQTLADGQAATKDRGAQHTLLQAVPDSANVKHKPQAVSTSDTTSETRGNGGPQLLPESNSRLHPDAH